MKVHVLEEGRFDESTIVGVFSSVELAQAQRPGADWSDYADGLCVCRREIKLNNGYWINIREYEVDKAS